MKRLFKTQHGLDAWIAAHTGRAGAYHVMVLHDDACSPSRCSCKPWFEVRDLTTDAVLEGQRLQDKWTKETAS
jgi:hypothetical protein